MGNIKCSEQIQTFNTPK